MHVLLSFTYLLLQRCMGTERVVQCMSDISRLADNGCDGDRGMSRSLISSVCRYTLHESIGEAVPAAWLSQLRTSRLQRA